MRHDTHTAWYTGDPKLLRRHTEGFWRTDEGRKVHVPLARTISALSASLLFAGSPTLTLGVGKDQSLFDEALKQTGFYSKLLQAAELCSAYGGVYLHLQWDRAQSRFPQIAISPPMAAEPAYQGETLRSVRFRELVRRDEQTKVGYWLVQEYTADGLIRSELWKGAGEAPSERLPLGALKETAWIEPEADSGTGVLCACYVPNRLPNPAFPSGREGASDYDGLDALLSALDEAYTALLRDVRLGKARIIVPMEFLRRKELLLQRCEGAAPNWVFDLDEEVFTALDINPQDSGAGITVAQSQIRAAELESVIDGLVKRIFIGAGYSPQSAGLGEYGAAESGTALNIRERLSMQTTESKKTHWWHALTRFGDALWRLTQALHDIEPTPAELSVAFADNVQPDLASVSDIVSKLSAAGALSTESKVRLIAPDAADPEVAAEARRIQRESGSDAI